MDEVAIEDRFGDELTVSADLGQVHVDGAPVSDWLFTPRQARKLAKALKRAAKAAEAAE